MRAATWAMILFLRAVAATAQTSLPEAYAEIVAPMSERVRSCLDRAQGEADPARFCFLATDRYCFAWVRGYYDTLGMAWCSGVLEEAWNIELERVWALVLARWSGGEAEEPLLAAQRAWLAWRAAECGFADARVRGGTARAYAGSGCRVRLTAERVVDLRERVP